VEQLARSTDSSEAGGGYVGAMSMQSSECSRRTSELGIGMCRTSGQFRRMIDHHNNGKSHRDQSGQRVVKPNSARRGNGKVSVWGHPGIAQQNPG
jgi:hypothetical protein